jgi:FMN phosphatase YigB (HAD superfamily)
VSGPGAVLLDFFGTTAVHRSADDWIDAAATGDAPSDAERARARERLGSVWADAAESFPAGSWDLDPDTHRQAFVQFVATVAGHGVPLAVVSNTGIDVRPILRRWGIERSFEAVVLSFEVGCVKPDPRIFRLAADALGFQRPLAS